MAERERLIDIFQDCKCNHLFRDNADMLAFANYLFDSGVIVPPCKVGDTVYYINTVPHSIVSKHNIQSRCCANCDNAFRNISCYSDT